MSFVNIFGGPQIPPSNNSYSSLDLATAPGNEFFLEWPIAFSENSVVVASIIDVTATSGSSGVIYLPRADEVSVGQSILFNNLAADSFILKNHDGSVEIATVDAGTATYIYVTDNTTENGVWDVIAFGAGSSQAQASALAGFGLVALNSKLNTNVPTVLLSSDTVLTASDRAKLIVWKGGTGSVTLPVPGATGVGNGFFVTFSNQNTVSGLLTVVASPGTLINGSPTFSVSYFESVQLVSDGINWYSFGFGRTSLSAVSVNALNVSGNTNVTLSLVQASAVIQEYSGALTGNIEIITPLLPQTYYVYNNTTGAFDLTFTTDGSSGVVVPQGGTLIFFHDGSFGGLYQIPSELDPSTISFPDGTVSLPGIKFTNSISTGFSRDAGTGALKTSVAGTEIVSAESGKFIVSGVNKLIINNDSGSDPTLYWGSNDQTGLHASLGSVFQIAGGIIVTQAEAGVFNISNNNNLNIVSPGSALNPSLTWGGFTLTGLHATNTSVFTSVAGGDVTEATIGKFVISGSNKLNINNNSGASDPTLYWNTDDTTGLHAHLGSLFFIAGGTVVTQATPGEFIIRTGNNLNIADNGSAADPSLYWGGVTSTGMHGGSTSVFTSVSGADVTQATTGKFVISGSNNLNINNLGTAGSPSLYWGATTNTGLHAAAASVFTTISGSDVTQATTGKFVISGSNTLNINNLGTASLPSLYWGATTNTGLHATATSVFTSISGGDVTEATTGKFVISGSNNLNINNLGTASLPSLYWSTNTTTGLHATATSVFTTISGGDVTEATTGKFVISGANNLNINNLGTASLPSLYWSTNTTTGLHATATSVFTSISGGDVTEATTGKFVISGSNKLNINDLGSVTLPSLYWGTDATTGFYSTSGSIFSTISGVSVTQTTTGVFIVTGSNKLNIANLGTAGAPSIFWNGTPGTGFHAAAASVFTSISGSDVTEATTGKFVISGSNNLNINNLGTAGLPSLYWSTNTTTGLHAAATSVFTTISGGDVTEATTGKFVISGSNTLNINNLGTASLPSLYWGATTNTGLHATSGSVFTAASGVDVTQAASGLFTLSTNTKLNITSLGTSSLPSIYWGADTATGISGVSGGVQISGSGVLGMSISGGNAATAVLSPYGTSAGNTGNLRFLELSANGTEYTQLKAADSISSNVSLTLPSALGLASSVPLVADTSGIMGFMGPVRDYRNLIIGGDFATNPWQRGTSVATIANGTYVADRFMYSKNGTMVHTVSKAAVAPGNSSLPFSSQSLTYTVTTGQAVIGTNDFCSIETSIEGLSLASVWQLPLVMSFWVNATTTGVYSVALRSARSGASNYYCIQNFTINTTNTWQFVTVSFPALPSAGSGTFNLTTGALGLNVVITLAGGSGVQGTAGSWQTSGGATVPICTSSQVNGVTTASTTFRIALIQLEAGNVVTPFSSLPADVVARQCRRYWTQSYSAGTAAGTNTAIGLWTGYINIPVSGIPNGSNMQVVNPPQFAAVNDAFQEVVTIYTQPGLAGSWTLGQSGTGAGTDRALTVTNVSPTGFEFINNTGGSLGIQQGLAVGHFTVNCELM